MTTDSAAKTIRLIDDASEKEYRVTIMPGDTFTDVLSQAGLDVNNYNALKPDQTNYAPDDDVYPNVNENGKLHLTMKAKVGSSLEGWIRSTPYIQKLLRRLGLTYRPQVTVSKASSTYAKDMGWKARQIPDGILHYGYYYAVGKRWQGSVVEQGGKFIFRIYDPPMSIIRGTEWEGCFHSISPSTPLYQIHFKPRWLPRDPSGGIAEINSILVVCINQASRRKK